MTTSNISELTSDLTTLQELFLEKSGTYTFLVPPERCADIFLQSKMKKVVKYDVYLDILLMVSFFVINNDF